MNSMLISDEGDATPQWERGVVPVAVVLISLNEAHNMAAVLENLKGWAQEVFLVDSYSSDGTVTIALQQGIHVVQRSFRGSRTTMRESANSSQASPARSSGRSGGSNAGNAARTSSGCFCQ